MEDNTPQDNDHNARPYPDHVSGTFMDKSKLPPHILEKMKQNQQDRAPQDNIPQVAEKFYEGLAELRADLKDIKFDANGHKAYLKGLKHASAKHASLESRIAELEKVRLDACIEIAELQVTVALLEQENARLNDTIEVLNNWGKP